MSAATTDQEGPTAARNFWKARYQAYSFLANDVRSYKTGLCLRDGSKGQDSAQLRKLQGLGKAEGQGARRDRRLHHSPDLADDLPRKPLQAAPQLLYLAPQGHQTGQHEVQALQHVLLPRSWKAGQHRGISSLTGDRPKRPH